jgi:LEA14-like dessication related protein
MIRRVWGRGAWVVLLGGCTPLGLWLYEEPVVTVARVTLELNETRVPGAVPVVVALAVDNRNDYALSTERVELSLRLDGLPVGQLERDSPVSVAMAEISTIALALPPEKQTTPEVLVALGTGTHTFAVKGRATFQTPFGMRKVRFEQVGAMIFGKRPSSSSP